MYSYRTIEEFNSSYHILLPTHQESMTSSYIGIKNTPQLKMYTLNQYVNILVPVRKITRYCTMIHIRGKLPKH